MRMIRGRAGMTLLELLIAMTIVGLVVGTAMSFFQQQGQAMSAGTSQLVVLQNHRYALATLRRDLRTAGAGVSGGQPWLVYAGEDVVAFNANHTTRHPSDATAVYVDTAALPGTADALTRATRITIPTTSAGYPDTTYLEQGTNSPAETLVFFFAPDTTTARGDDFALYRQVNDDAPAVVARNLLRDGDKPFFEYLRLLERDTAAALLSPVPATRVPLRHAERLHGSPRDTGDVALIDRVRAVRVQLRATNGKTGEREVTRAATRVVRLPNARIATLQSCGDEPVLGTALSARQVFAGGAPAVLLAWGQAADERGGEADILRYVVYRKDATDTGPDWGSPHVSIPAGLSGYEFVDAQVEPGKTYRYALAAQDCSPSLSALTPPVPVTILP